MLRKYKLTLLYDGTLYKGWQVQPNGLTIQEVLQQKASIVLRHPVFITGAGRTDTGVHARGQTAHFTTEQPMEKRRFLHSMNQLLPPDIRIKEMEEVPLTFHARKSAVSKVYHYHLYLESVMDPTKRLYTLHVQEKCDVSALATAASFLVGTHDFTSFASDGSRGIASYDSIRTIERLNLVQEEGGLKLEFQADGFLYKMVRNIVGTLLEVASGKRAAEEIPLILGARDRRRAGKAAAPQGLFLHQVFYS